MRRLVAAAAAVALVLVGGAAAADPGVTPDEVVLGGTVPLSGIASAFGAVGPGARAYFDYVNARGGVHGRKIRYVFYDDAYNPAQTVQQTRRLVEQDRVFAIFNSVGTENNKAIQPYLNQAKVPQLYVGDGSDAVTRPGTFPWTMGFLQSYRGEGAVYGRHLARTRPNARVAVLFQNDDLGEDMTRGLSRALAGKRARIVASQPYDFTASDVASQVARLRSSGADTLMLFATPVFFLRAIAETHKLGWKPQLYIASVSIEPTIMASARLTAPELTRGALSVAFVKNPNDPLWDRDPVMALYRQVMKRYLPAGKPSDVYNFYGMTVAWTMVDTLQRAGRNLTRATLLRAAQSLNTQQNPFLLPGIRLVTSARDYSPLSTIYVYRYDNAQWVRSSGLLAAR